MGICLPFSRSASSPLRQVPGATGVVSGWKPIVGPVLATLVLYAACMGLYVVKHGGDPCTLCCVGKNRAGQPPYEAVKISIGPTGYDGQFYYVISRSPWSRQSGTSMDAPAARQLRILYPTLCWLFSAGQARLLFYVMPAVNLLILAALAAAGAWMAIRHGQSPWWGFLLPWALNAGLPALHNLTDPLSMLAVFGLLSAWLVRGPCWLMALSGAAAVFSREQNLIVLAILAAAGLWTKRYSVAASLAAVIVLWGAWALILRGSYGAWPFLQGQGNFGWPLSGMFYRWTHLGGNLTFSTRLSIIFGLSMVHLLVQMGLAVYFGTRKVDGAITACMIAGAVLAVFASTLIFGDFWSYTRVFVWMPMGIWLGSLQLGKQWPMIALTPALLWTLVGSLRYV